LFLIAFAAACAATQAIAQSPSAMSQPEPAAKPVKFSMTHVESSKPQIVRICYLEEGTREVVLPPAVVLNPGASSEKTEADPAEPQIIHISNLDDGSREIVVLPSQ
jgi:hypothetical protein